MKEPLVSGEPVKSCGHHDMSPRCVSPFHPLRCELTSTAATSPGRATPPRLVTAPCDLHHWQHVAAMSYKPCGSPTPAASLHKPVVTNTMPRHLQGTCKFRSLQYVADTPHTAHTFRFALALLQALQLANTPQAPLPTTPCLASPANVFVKPPPMPRHCDTQAHSSPTTDHATASPTATNTHGSPLPRPASPQPSSPHRAAMRAPRAANTNAHAPQTNCSRASPAATDTVPRRPYGNGKFGDGDGDRMGGYGGGRDIR